MAATYWTLVTRELWEDRNRLRPVAGFAFTGRARECEPPDLYILAEAVDDGAPEDLNGRTVVPTFASIAEPSGATVIDRRVSISTRADDRASRLSAMPATGPHDQPLHVTGIAFASRPRWDR